MSGYTSATEETLMNEPKWKRRLNEKMMARARKSLEEQHRTVIQEAIEKAQLQDYPQKIQLKQFSKDKWNFTVEGASGKLVCTYYPDSTIQRAIKPFLNMPPIQDEDFVDEAVRRGVKPEQIEEVVSNWKQEVAFNSNQRIARAENAARSHLFMHLPAALFETLAELSIQVLLLTGHTMLRMPDIKRRINKASEQRQKFTQQRLGSGKGKFLNVVTFAIEHKEAIERLMDRGEERTPGNIAKEMGYKSVRGFHKALKTIGYQSKGDKGLVIREEKLDELHRQMKELNQQK